MSHIVLWLLLGVGLSSAANLWSHPDLETDAELADHVRRITRAVNAEGYALATLHRTSFLSGEETRLRLSGLAVSNRHSLTKRDVEDYAAHPSTESRNIELRLTSGERLRMSVQKRSAMSPDVTVLERAFGREELRRPQVRDCFFSGGLVGAEGHASLSLCDGKVVGAIRAGKRDYEVHALPETAAIRRRRAEKRFRALVTWSDSEEESDFDNSDLIIPDVSGEVPTKPDTLTKAETQAMASKNATIEVGVYMDRFVLAKLEERLGLSTTEELTDLISLKWSGIYTLLSNPKVTGWNITIRVVHLEIWRESPSWYNESNRSFGGRMGNLCEHTTHLPFDHIMLESADGKPKRIKGVSYLGTMCNSRWRCSVSMVASYRHWVEAHETGHSIGLAHDKSFTSCDPNVPKGFMSMQEYVFRDCYRPVLDRSLSSRTCLFKDNVDISKYNSVNNVVPLYKGQELSLDGQCKLKNGDGFEYLHIPSADICANATCIRKFPFRELSETPSFVGTSCGKDRMCIDDACVSLLDTLNPNYVRPLVREGGWGPWSSPSPCDNTCGGAVSVSTRQCNSPEPRISPYCEGSAFKAQMCPSRQKACPGESSVESELIKQRANAICNKVKVSGTSPHILTGEGNLFPTSGEINKCTVTCRVVNSDSIGRFVLQDGTPCSGLSNGRNHDSKVRGISWRCVQGQCLAFGCNGKSLGEGGGVEKDRCGVCGGDGSSCPK